MGGTSLALLALVLAALTGRASAAAAAAQFPKPALAAS